MLSKAGRRRSTEVAIVGAFVIAIVTLLIGQWQRNANQTAFDTNFSSLTNEFAALVTDRFTLYQYGLRAARGVIVAGGGKNLTRRTFSEYFRSREQFEEFPGARGIGYIERVPATDVDAFVARAKADGFPEFRVRELASNAGERFLIRYIYPLEGNEGATGLDIASEQNRRSAANTAGRTGDARLTAPITLVQASGETNHGFLILLPIYSNGMPLNTPEQRLAANFGWSYSPLVVSEVLKDLGPRRDEIAFSLTDLGDSTEFYRSPGFDAADVVNTREVTVMGRQWRIGFHALPQFTARYEGTRPLVLAIAVGAAGLLIVLGAAGYMRARESQWQERRDDEEFAFKIVDAAPQALLVVDEQGTIVLANHYCDQLFGWPANELKGRNVDELVPEAYREAHSRLRSEYDQRARNMGDRRELKALRADGTEFPIIVRLSPISIGRRQLVVAGITDITVERNALQVLETSQQRWQELANTLPHLVWTCDETGACDFLSEQWSEYTGVPAEEGLGTKWMDLVHPDDREHLIAKWQQFVETKESYSIEYRLRRHDGQYRLFYTRAEPITDDDGNLVRWIGSNTDIEDRHQAELQVRELLQDMEQRVATRTGELNVALRDLQNVLDSVPSLIAYWDKEGRNRFANKAYEEWFGMTPAEIKGLYLSDLIGTSNYEQSEPYICAVLDGQRQVFERELHDAIGNRRTVQVQYLPDIADGEVLGFYSLVLDISAIKESERMQKRAREAAEAATRAKSAFLTSMSHELRTPLNSILGFADLLTTQHFGPLSDKQQEHVGLIRKSGEHLLNLMDGVLELSKVEAGRITVSIEPVNALTAVKSAISQLEILAERYGIEIRTRGFDSGQAYIRADLTRLAQVLINLGSNAIKYNRRGGWVEFSQSKVVEGELRIEVADNGLGIPKERQSGAFQPFNRMGAEQGEVEGTGIGLALVKNFVELMGGHIGFESEEGKGSRFWIDMQLSQEGEDLPEADDTGQILLGAAGAGAPLRVLYVEDNEINRSLFRYFVETIDNVELLEAEDGPAGLAAARAEKPDVIFLDINLPGMNGYDVLREIREDPDISKTPVIALTANAMSGDSERGLSAGFDKYLPKPIRLNILVDVLAQEREHLSKS